ncbi:hypothetical protein T08_5396, partial [Trichinella sp. T8]
MNGASYARKCLQHAPGPTHSWKRRMRAKEPMATPALTEKSGSKSQLGKLKP